MEHISHLVYEVGEKAFDFIRIDLDIDMVKSCLNSGDQ